MTIASFDQLNPEKKREILHSCCGSSAWVNKMMTVFPAEDLIDLLESAEEKWYECTPDEWLAAFARHPKIGDIKSAAGTPEAGEQSGVDPGNGQMLEALAAANKTYEDKFGFIFIVFATGKTAAEMLQILKSRLHNDRDTEIRTAADEQNKITMLRLEKLFDI